MELKPYLFVRSTKTTKTNPDKSVNQAYLLKVYRSGNGFKTKPISPSTGKDMNSAQSSGFWAEGNTIEELADYMEMFDIEIIDVNRETPCFYGNSSTRFADLVLEKVYNY